MKLVIGSDKSGFALKQALRAFLDCEGIEYDDLGTQSPENGKPYFEVASAVAKKLQDKTYDRAVLICGTGAGMCITANKFKGVHAVVCESVYTASMCRAINDANVLCLGGWVIAPEMGIELVKAFLSRDFLEGLEPWRQEFLSNAKEKLSLIEDEIYD